MTKISFQQFQKIMDYDVVAEKACIEIAFAIDNDSKYNDCWMGKTKTNDNSGIYWFGLLADGSEASEYDSFEDMVNAKVFGGKCLRDIWPKVILDSIDACSVEERLPFYN
jgi:hypothetical protein